MIKKSQMKQMIKKPQRIKICYKHHKKARQFSHLIQIQQKLGIIQQSTNLISKDYQFKIN